MTDQQIDEMVREASEPDAGTDRDAAKVAARQQLLMRAETAGDGRTRKRSGLGWRGMAAIAAILIVPTGAAVAAQLGSERSEVTDANGNAIALDAEDCPEFLAAAEVRGLSTEGLVLADCPEATAELEKIFGLVRAMMERRSALDARVAEREERRAEAVGGFGLSEDGETYGLEGIAGSSGG